MKKLTFKKIIILLLIIGCKTNKTPINSYGLNTVEISFDSKQLSKLNMTVFDKVPVSATLKYKGDLYNISVAYSGKSTLDDLKKSYQIHFNKKAFKNSSDYRISAQSMDNTGVRSLIGFHIYESNNVISPEIEPISLYVNNKFQGLYFLIETIDKDFYKRKHIQPQTIYKARNGSATMEKENLLNIKEGFSVKMKPKSYAGIRSLIKTLNTELSESNSTAIKKNFEINQYLDYMVATILLNNWDGYRNNYFLYNDSKDSKYRFTPWDLDKVYDTTFPLKEPLKIYDLFGGSFHSQSILMHQDYKNKYLKLILDRQKTFSYQYINEKIDQFAATIKFAALADPTLPNSEKDFQHQIARIKEHAKKWSKILENEVKKQLNN